MPTVPSTGALEPSVGAAQPSPSDLLMAAASMQEKGMLGKSALPDSTKGKKRNRPLKVMK